MAGFTCAAASVEVEAVFNRYVPFYSIKRGLFMLLRETVLFTPGCVIWGSSVATWGERPPELQVRLLRPPVMLTSYTHSHTKQTKRERERQRESCHGVSA